MESIFANQFIQQLQNLRATFKNTHAALDNNDGLVRNANNAQPVPLTAFSTLNPSTTTNNAPWKGTPKNMHVMMVVNVTVKFLKKPTGYEGQMQHQFEVDLNSHTASHLKDFVYKKTRLPTTAQRLVYKGKALADDHLLKDYYDSGEGWVVTCLCTPGVSVEADVQPDGAGGVGKQGTSGKQLSSEFWEGLENYLKLHLDESQVGKVLRSFKQSLQSQKEQ